MAFSGVDKALLQRAARILESEARGIEKAETVGGSWAKVRAAKRHFDALLRDARDLRSLSNRLVPKKPLPTKAPAESAADEMKRMALSGGTIDLTREAVGG